jgi:hypothetical protein
MPARYKLKCVAVFGDDDLVLLIFFNAAAKKATFLCAEEPLPLLSLHLNHNGSLLVAGSAGGSVHIAGNDVQLVCLFY